LSHRWKVNRVNKEKASGKCSETAKVKLDAITKKGPLGEEINFLVTRPLLHLKTESLAKAPRQRLERSRKSLMSKKKLQCGKGGAGERGEEALFVHPLRRDHGMRNLALNQRKGARRSPPKSKQGLRRDDTGRLCRYTARRLKRGKSVVSTQTGRKREN